MARLRTEFLRLPRRRREAPLELRVLARPLLEVRRARPRALLRVGLEGVLLAGVLRCFEVLWVCLWLLLARRGDERVFVASGGPSPLVRGSGRAREAKLLGEPRALSRRHATSLFLWRSLARFGAFRSASGLLAALVCARCPRGDGGREGDVLGTDPSRQCFGLEHLR